MKIKFALAVALVALTPIAASAYTQEDQNACMDDALNICGQYIPDRGRVAACLAANSSRISSACRAAMARYAPPATSTTTAQRTKPSTVR